MRAITHKLVFELAEDLLFDLNEYDIEVRLLGSSRGTEWVKEYCLYVIHRGPISNTLYKQQKSKMGNFLGQHYFCLKSIKHAKTQCQFMHLQCLWKK